MTKLINHLNNAYTKSTYILLSTYFVLSKINSKSNFVHLKIQIITMTISIRWYSRENGGLAKNFDKQIIQFKRTWVGYHHSKIL